jgi:two-component system, LytTR family, response regulator
MKFMRTVFIEDTESHRNTIRQMLSEFPSVQIVGEADSIESGYELIVREKPNLAILDVELYPGTSFDILNRLQADNLTDFEIIFLTGFSSFEYSVRAIQYAALDFLTKPLDRERLKEAMERAEKKIEQRRVPAIYYDQINALLQNLKNPPDKRSSRIIFHRAGGGLEFVDVKDIVYCEADKDTTNVFMQNKQKFTAVRNLSYYARPLEIDFNFFRISDKYLVNLEYLKLYEHNQDYKLTLTDGGILYASRRGGQDLKQYLQDMYAPQSKPAAAPNEPDGQGILDLLRKLLS